MVMDYHNNCEVVTIAFEFVVKTKDEYYPLQERRTFALYECSRRKVLSGYQQ